MWRVKSIVQPANDSFGDGLGPIDIRGLNRIVIIAGANGSGKTRLLDRVERGGLHTPLESLDEISLNEKLRRREPPIRFVAKDFQFANPEDMSPSNISQFFSSVEQQPGMHLISHATLPYIQRIQDNWWDATHQLNQEPTSVRDEKKQSYEELCKLIATVLGSPLERDNNGNPTLFGRIIYRANLSDGQKALLIWCVALHAKGIRLAERIILMDEPENHLHPESVISMVDRIVVANPDGQLWIATHSVPLIAALYCNRSDDVSLYFMQSGSIAFASDQPEIVLASLLGGEGNIAALREFIDLPEVFATNRFAAQCLTTPDVAATATESDPQVGIVNSVIDCEPSSIKLLDFGCGKGRLLTSLVARYGSDLPRKIDYVGWDRASPDRELCERVIETAYNERTSRWFCDRQEFAARHPSGHFDFVVMCNVLHEIDPTFWVELFSKTGVINQSLKDSGTLILIEDYLMPKGEYAHPFGFIVLDTEPLQKLFCAGIGEDQIQVQSERKGRIKGHFIPKRLLSNVSNESRREALTFAQKYARERINDLRAAGTADFKAGRAHGFWVQQYANTTLALDAT